MSSSLDYHQLFFVLNTILTPSHDGVGEVPLDAKVLLLSANPRHSRFSIIVSYHPYIKTSSQTEMKGLTFRDGCWKEKDERRRRGSI